VISAQARAKVGDPEINDAVTMLREDVLGLFLILLTIGYLTWLCVSTLILPIDTAARQWLMVPVIVICLAGSYYLSQRSYDLAVKFLLGMLTASVTAALWVFDAPPIASFYPLIALVAVVLLSPLAGLLVSAGSLVLLIALVRVGLFAFLPPDRLAETAIASLLTIGTAWALEHNMITAVEWSLQNYDEARHSAEDAQNHRAKLVRALKQLDIAYYRLQHANSALALAWKAAETAEHAKATFVTQISHELRTPLNLIIGFSEMITTSPETYGVVLPPVYRGDLNAIFRSAQHLRKLTDDVIDLARVSAGRLVLAREPVELSRVIDEACAMVREYLATKNLNLAIKLDSDLPVLQIDRLRIRQVLLNLLTNAARFTERGGIVVSADCDGPEIIVRVADSGSGIAAENLSRVFEEFATEQTPAPQPFAGLGGVGLGLPISKRFVELHGGKMGVESSVGAGTTFWFSLPIEPLDGGSTAGSGRNWPFLTRLAGQRTVVLAGSKWDFVHFLQSHLHGYRVLSAADIQGAIAKAATVQAVAVLVNIDAAIEAVEANTSIPILRLPFPHRQLIAADLGVTDYLAKPVSRSDLEEAIGRVDGTIETVLVVDDDPHFIRLMSRFLQASGSTSTCRILAAQDGREALAILEKTRPDLILLDLAMPELSGIEVLASIRASSLGASIPVIIVSAQDQLEGQLRLPGQVSVSRSDGFSLDGLLASLEALLGTLAPSRSDSDPIEDDTVP
jgi:signal transduction histidine kinase/CheY-like chemotaxis protein